MGQRRRRDRGRIIALLRQGVTACEGHGPDDGIGPGVTGGVPANGAPLARQSAPVLQRAARFADHPPSIQAHVTFLARRNE